MFAYLISVLPMVFVVVLVGVANSYVGDGFRRGVSQANLQQLLGESQQIVGSAEMFRTSHGVSPQSLDALLDENYLRSIPKAGKWTLAEGYLFTEPDVANEAMCLEINRLAGVEGPFQHPSSNPGIPACHDTSVLKTPQAVCCDG